MKTALRSAVTAMGLAASVAPTAADMRAASACAASLTASQMLIYRAVLPELKPGTDLPSLIRSKAMALVSDGRLSMSAAPDDAMAAGRCLRMVHP